MRLPEKRIAVNVQNNRQSGLSQQNRVSGAGATAIAEAVSGAGDAVAETANRIRDAQIANDVAGAESKLRLGLDKVIRDIRNDGSGDPAEFEKRYNEAVDTQIEGASGGLTSPAHRRLWQQHAQGIRDGGLSEVRDIRRARQVDDLRAGLTQQGAVFGQAAADPAVSPKALAEVEKTYGELINRQEAAGVITSENAALLRVDAGTKVRAGISDRHRLNAESLLDDGRAGEAEAYLLANGGEILPAEREALNDLIHGKGIEVEAVGIADGFIERGLTREQARDEIRQIDNLEVRKKAEQRFDYEVAQRQQEQADGQEAVLNDYHLDVRSGAIRVRDIPVSELKKLSLTQVNQLEAIEKRRLAAAGSGAASTSRQSLANFYSRFAEHGSDSARQYVLDHAGEFSDKDFASLLSKASPKASDEGRRSLLALQQSVKNSLAVAGITNKRELAELEAEIIHQINEDAQRYEDEHGRPPDDRWRDERIELLLTPIILGGKDIRILDAPSIEIDGIPAEDTEAVLRATVGLNGSQKPKELAQIYNLTQRALTSEGIAITPENIERGVRGLIDNPELIAAHQHDEKVELLDKWHQMHPYGGGRTRPTGVGRFFQALVDTSSGRLEEQFRDVAGLEREPEEVERDRQNDTIDDVIKETTGLNADELREWLKREGR